MENSITRIKNWISAKFQFIMLVILIFIITLIVKQQSDISNLKKEINVVNNNVYDAINKFDDIEKKLDDVESSLSGDIEAVRRAVIIWSD